MEYFVNDLSKSYRRRFGADVDFRSEMYRILCEDFFQDYVLPTDNVLDLGAGYCGFANNIQATSVAALDADPEVEKCAASWVKPFVGPSDRLDISSNSLDVVFSSNLLEHLSREKIVKTLKEVHTVLKPGGFFLIMCPNYRYCYEDYFMFFDHITPLDDRSLTEVLELNGFSIVKTIPRFLPYTTKGSLPKSLSLLKLYLWLPAIWPFFGKQMFICAEKVKPKEVHS